MEGKKRKIEEITPNPEDPPDTDSKYKLVISNEMKSSILEYILQFLKNREFLQKEISMSPSNNITEEWRKTIENSSLLLKMPPSVNNSVFLNGICSKFGRVLNLIVSFWDNPEFAVVTFSRQNAARAAFRSEGLKLYSIKCTFLKSATTSEKSSTAISTPATFVSATFEGMLTSSEEPSGAKKMKFSANRKVSHTQTSGEAQTVEQTPILEQEETLGQIWEQAHTWGQPQSDWEEAHTSKQTLGWEEPKVSEQAQALEQAQATEQAHTSEQALTWEQAHTLSEAWNQARASGEAQAWEQAETWEWEQGQASEDSEMKEDDEAAALPPNDAGAAFLAIPSTSKQDDTEMASTSYSGPKAKVGRRGRQKPPRDKKGKFRRASTNTDTPVSGDPNFHKIRRKELIKLQGELEAARAKLEKTQKMLGETNLDGLRVIDLWNKTESLVKLISYIEFRISEL